VIALPEEIYILVVDDIPLIGRMINHEIEKFGRSILQALDGKEALELLKKHRDKIELIFLDWYMPGMNGLQLLEIIKSDSRFQHIPVIMLTSESKKSNIVQAYKAGICDYMVKPFSVEDLHKKMLKGLNHKQTINRILLVDDSLVIHRMLRNMLEKKGYVICGDAMNGEEAIDLYHRLLPDLIIMDITMPIMDGLTAAEEIKKMNNEAKIIILSAEDHDDHREKAKQIGINTFLKKPFDEGMIAQAIAMTRHADGSSTSK
jgi:two-component system, chemotaxis family, chemotaxis protein CheY